MEYLRSRQWIPCNIVSELPHCLIISYTWQGVAYQCRAAHNLIRKMEK